MTVQEIERYLPQIVEELRQWQELKLVGPFLSDTPIEDVLRDGLVTVRKHLTAQASSTSTT